MDNPVERASEAIEQALATRAASNGQPPDDHFENQAQATLSQWAALRRALERANEVIDELRSDKAQADARIGELVRANQQLSNSLETSIEREGAARAQAGWLKGLMTSAAGALMEGIGPVKQTARGGQAIPWHPGLGAEPQ